MDYKISIIGTGLMGYPMSQNISKTFYLKAYNRTFDRMRGLESNNIKLCKSVEEVCENSNIIISMLPGDKEVLETVKKVSNFVQSETIFIDMSSTKVSTANECFNILRLVNVDFLDAPVSGGPEGAKSASLAIMVGGNTVRQDNPSLTARDNAGEPLSDQPLRVIVDGYGIDSESNVMNQPGDVVIAVSSIEIVDDLEKIGAKVEFVPNSNGKVHLISLMKTLASKYDITNILVEGGGKLAGALFDLGLVDRIAVFVSPMIIGGEKAITGVEGKGVDWIKDAFHLNDIEMIKLGKDFLITGSIR